MEIIDSKVASYSEAHTADESPILKKITRETHINVLKPRMLSGHLQGRLLSMISHMTRPRVILEIGTYTGYSAICLAEGLAPGGKLITIDRNEELYGRVKNYFEEAGLASSIDYRIGNARQIIPTINEMFDLVFIDADKESNAFYYDLVIASVPIGGHLLVDNVLWSGKVLEASPDKHTLSIHDFNKKIQADERVENVLLPLRDGIMLMRKVSN